MNNVYVAGMETISSLGCGLKDHIKGIRNGISGSKFIRRFNASSFSTKFGCEVTADLTELKKNIDPDIVETFLFDRKVELFTCCIELLREKIDKMASLVTQHQIGVFTGVGTETLSDEYITSFVNLSENECLEVFNHYNNLLPHINKIINPSHIITLYAASICKSTGVRHTNLSACAASTQALGCAYQAIRSGRCAAALVGGVDSTINPFILTAFSQLNMTSTRNDSPSTASRPFDKTRDGFVPGEGAGVVILVNEKVAGKMGDPLARIAGYGSSLDAYKITSPHEDGLGAQYAMERCLKAANWEPHNVEYVNAHGTSTPINDVTECKALKSVFADSLKDILISSTKSQIGHLIAAAGIVEFITTVAAMNDGFVPPSINVFKQDDACLVNLVTEIGLKRNIRRAMTNSFALAGQNATLAIEAV